MNNENVTEIEGTIESAPLNPDVIPPMPDSIWMTLNRGDGGKCYWVVWTSAPSRLATELPEHRHVIRLKDFK